MLDLMRRKKQLKAVLWLVIIGLALGMLLLFVPGQNVGVAGFETSVASVDGEAIPIKEFINIYRRVLDQYSAGGKNKMDPDLMRQLGLDRQAVNALINIAVVKYAARNLGLDVSPEEIRRAVESNPNLQDRGAFVGVDRYKAILAANGTTPAEFEESIRYILLVRKIRNVISDSLDLTETELKNEFLKSNQEAQVRFVLLKNDDFKKQVAPTEAALRAYFEANKEKYRIKEERRAQYLLLSLESVGPTMTVTDKEIQERWDKESHEETVDASHILFEFKESSQEAGVKAKAEAVLKRAKAGEDFAELAKKNSQDTISAKQGGNLGPFSRGRMVKEFEDVAFSLKPGEISDPVRTKYGYHIIKVLSHNNPTLEVSRKSIERTIQMDKASELIKQKAVDAQREGDKVKDLNIIAKSLNIPTEIRETPFISKDSDPFASRVSAALLEEIFRLKEIGAIGRAVDHPQGYAIPKLLETRLPRPPDFKESRTAIEKDYIESKARELLQAEAKSLSEEAWKLGDLSKAVAKTKIQVKESLTFKRPDIPDPEIGTSSAFNAAAFELDIGKVSSPINLDAGNRIAILQVKSRSPFDEAAFQKQKADLRNRLLTNWQDNYFQEYIRRVTESLEKAGKIRINQKAMDMVTGLRS